MKTSVIAIFDIGKTNKKFFLFNQQYSIVLERSVQFTETMDEDGFPSDNLPQLIQWVQTTLQEIMQLNEYLVKAINFSAYGASFVHLDGNGEAMGPLYNYLKPLPAGLQENLYRQYSGEENISLATASPVLGNLNSGMQLYWLKQARPDFFAKIQCSLHLPQFISYLITQKTCSEITSIGCHTGLWDFGKKQYHEWVYAEELDKKFPPVLRSDTALDISIGSAGIKAGIGLHDSSAALVPYLASFPEPFVLISTGTWCISLNAFNNEPLTTKELEQDCLCYLEYHRRPVKAARVFAGNEHEQQVKKIAAHFKRSPDGFQTMRFNPLLFKKIAAAETGAAIDLKQSAFSQRKLSDFASCEEAYHQLVYDLVQQQQKSTSLVLSAKPPSRIFVDGGFAKNDVFMHMLAAAFPSMEIFGAAVSQATAMGAALVLHHEWNEEPVPGNIIELTKYTIINE